MLRGQDGVSLGEHDPSQAEYGIVLDTISAHLASLLTADQRLGMSRDVLVLGSS
jgi:hypothetical protein